MASQPALMFVTLILGDSGPDSGQGNDSSSAFPGQVPLAPSLCSEELQICQLKTSSGDTLSGHGEDADPWAKSQACYYGSLGAGTLESAALPCLPEGCWWSQSSAQIKGVVRNQGT